MKIAGHPGIPPIYGGEMQCPFCKEKYPYPVEECSSCETKFIVVNLIEDKEEEEFDPEAITQDDFDVLNGIRSIHENSLVRNLILNPIKKEYGKELARKALMAIRLGFPLNLLALNFTYVTSYGEFAVYAMLGDEVILSKPTFFLTQDPLLLRTADLEGVKIEFTSSNTVIFTKMIQEEEVFIVYFKPYQRFYIKAPYMLLGPAKNNPMEYMKKEVEHMEATGESFCETAIAKAKLPLYKLPIDAGWWEGLLSDSYIPLDTERILKEGLDKVAGEIIDEIKKHVTELLK